MRIQQQDHLYPYVYKCSSVLSSLVEVRSCREISDIQTIKATHKQQNYSNISKDAWRRCPCLSMFCSAPRPLKNTLFPPSSRRGTGIAMPAGPTRWERSSVIGRMNVYRFRRVLAASTCSTLRNVAPVSLLFVRRTHEVHI